ncbi:MAG TPA: tRNA pseudouridine synthase A, partial [Actinomycetota bacterium]|nr:tRNA pseudouridine synthase A [Actinomycetota bacterium]
ADALGRILGEAPRLSVAGRTDAGVHAEGQVVSFETDAEPPPLQRALNAMLGPEVAVREARAMPQGFDARHSATAREYRYRMRTDEVPDPFSARYEWHRPGSYDQSAMRRAARHLVGERDFASFCRPPKDGGSTVRRLERLTVRRVGERLEIGARANAFLHQMVRSLVGTLVAVGDGRIDPDAMPDVLAARDRAAAGRVAPPHGLVLVRVLYGGPK